MTREYVFDCEADGLEPTKIHCLGLITPSGKVFSTTDYDQMRSALLNADRLIAHNVQRFDVPNLERLLDIKITAQIVDTLPLSWALFPERQRHGLAVWGEEFGVPKPVVEDWFDQDESVYLHRVEEDVKINKRLWDTLKNKLDALYEDDQDRLWNYVDYLSFKMRCARLQEESRWKLDVDRVHKALAELLPEREEKVTLLKQVMPTVAIRTKKSQPKRMFNKAGDLTKLGADWLNLLYENKQPQNSTEIEVITGFEPPNLAVKFSVLNTNT